MLQQGMGCKLLLLLLLLLLLILNMVVPTAAQP